MTILFPSVVRVGGGETTIFQAVRVGKGRPRSLYTSLARAVRNGGDAKEGLVR